MISPLHFLCVQMQGASLRTLKSWEMMITRPARENWISATLWKTQRSRKEQWRTREHWRQRIQVTVMLNWTAMDSKESGLGDNMMEKRADMDSEVVLTQSMVVKKDALSKRHYRSKCVSLWSWLLVWVNCMDCRLQVN
ncbi:uncharacterized protein LOC117965193 isoform X7 [Acipenser ruthenus]|uniref:uncharacterized protein LOC117965193 isoform X7 n=1 Tax=Acipenser ruthenus TaxID=7906 RepID=UPI0027413A58|nr:uncharacterized protein LOC117965193 isoform X7 [Acipenser ruthenus]